MMQTEGQHSREGETQSTQRVDTGAFIENALRTEGAILNRRGHTSCSPIFSTAKECVVRMIVPPPAPSSGAGGRCAAFSLLRGGCLRLPPCFAVLRGIERDGAQAA